MLIFAARMTGHGPMAHFEQTENKKTADCGDDWHDFRFRTSDGWESTHGFGLTLGGLHRNFPKRLDVPFLHERLRMFWKKAYGLPCLFFTPQLLFP